MHRVLALLCSLFLLCWTGSDGLAQGMWQPVGSRLVVVTGVRLNDLEDVQRRTAALQSLARQVYAQFRDDADFLLVVANRRTIPPGTRVSGYHLRVSNSVAGLGVPLFNAGAQFGGTRRLQGVLYFPRWYAFWQAPFLHELSHQWANDALTTQEPGHWGFCRSGGQLGGFSTLRNLGGSKYQGFNLAERPFGTAANGRNVPYSDLELYLMGFLSAAQVQPVSCAVQPRWISLNRGIFSAQGMKIVTVQDIVRRVGPRVSDFRSSPRTFRLLAVLASEKPPTPAEVRLAEHAIRRITATGDDSDSSFNFNEATRGLGRLELVQPERLRR